MHLWHLMPHFKVWFSFIEGTINKHRNISGTLNESVFIACTASWKICMIDFVDIGRTWNSNESSTRVMINMYCCLHENWNQNPFLLWMHRIYSNYITTTKLEQNQINMSKIVTKPWHCLLIILSATCDNLCNNSNI